MRPAVLLVAALAAAAASAQPADWSTLSPGAGVAAPLASGFGDAWTTGAGATVRVETPAYRGRVRAEVRVAAYDALDATVPAFILVIPTLGWGPTASLGPVRLGGGARVGVGRFRLDDDEAGNLQDETELAVGAWAGGALRLGRAEVWAEVDATRLTLSDPVTLVSVAGGLAVRLDTPGWLRAVLR